MIALHSRSKILVRWTTTPADMGYGGGTSEWLKLPGEVMGIRRASAFPAELDRRVGQCVRLVQYKHRGRVVEHDEIRDAVFAMDYDRLLA